MARRKPPPPGPPPVVPPGSTYVVKPPFVVDIGKPAATREAEAARRAVTERLRDQALDLLSRLPSGLPSRELRVEMDDIAGDLAKAFDRSKDQVRKMLPGLWKKIIRK